MIFSCFSLLVRCIACAFPMLFLCLPYVFIVFHVVFMWLSYGFPMVFQMFFLWFCCSVLYRFWSDFANIRTSQNFLSIDRLQHQHNRWHLRFMSLVPLHRGSNKRTCTILLFWYECLQVTVKRHFARHKKTNLTKSVNLLDFFKAKDTAKSGWVETTK